MLAKRQTKHGVLPVWVAIALCLISAELLAKGCKDRPYCIGTPVDEEVYAAWDIDVKPDGHGLPDGDGSAVEGETIFLNNCAKCHGDKKDGFAGRSKYPILAPYPTLVGDEPPLDSTDPAPAQTVGSYWPYSSTLFDYIRRAMPFWHPESLSDDEVYALSAYILYLNKVTDDKKLRLNKENLFKIQMPNRDGFICDPRPDTHNTRCMSNCLTKQDGYAEKERYKEADAVRKNSKDHIIEASDCMPAF